MNERPYTIASCCISIDGYLDDGTPDRLVLSNPADLDRVDALRASCDAILVGAATVRRDNPRLLVRSESRQQQRVARGLPAHPLKVTLTAGGDLDASAAFFTCGESERLVYCRSSAVAEARERLADVATVVDAGEGDCLDPLIADLQARGVQRLMVEGGAQVLTQFLEQGLVDELQLAVAPLFVGDPAAHRFVGPGRFPHDSLHRADLLEVRQLGDVVLLRYGLGGVSPVNVTDGIVAGVRAKGAASCR